MDKVNGYQCRDSVSFRNYTGEKPQNEQEVDAYGPYRPELVTRNYSATWVGDAKPLHFGRLTVKMRHGDPDQFVHIFIRQVVQGLNLLLLGSGLAQRAGYLSEMDLSMEQVLGTIDPPNLNLYVGSIIVLHRQRFYGKAPTLGLSRLHRSLETKPPRHIRALRREDRNPGGSFPNRMHVCIGSERVKLDVP